MNVSAQSAQTIIEEISALIGRQINMMNEKDIIIASMDKNRVKTFHEAARKIIAEDSDEITVHSTTEYSGHCRRRTSRCAFTKNLRQSSELRGGSRTSTNMAGFLKR